MKYINASHVLPEELLSTVQKYYRGGYLYIPGYHTDAPKHSTAYRTELEKRNQRIYLKHLEGKTSGQLEQIYHLSKPSMRRILLKEKRRYQNMKETIERILPFWEMEGACLSQIYTSAWEIDASYVIKVYHSKNQLERNIKISELLSECNIPAARTVLTKTGESYVEDQGIYFLMSEKFPGSNLSDIRERETARKMGRAIARLHTAYLNCEREIDFWDNSLLKEMKGWVRETLEADGFSMFSQEEYTKAVAELEKEYDDLPKQLIHRDVHFGNFLFSEGEFSGYIDFDLSQRNIRIFDICYFLTGILSDEAENVFTEAEWLSQVGAVVSGYESILLLSAAEKRSVPCVMECIEILCAAYFLKIKDTKRAADACRTFHRIQNCEQAIRDALA